MNAREATAADVVAAIEDELRRGSAVGAGAASVQALLRRARDLQRGFRSQPIGGKLAGLKRVFYWWTASAFDRQAKAVEALLDAVDELAARQDLRPAAAADAPLRVGRGLSLDRALEIEAQMLLPERMLLYGLVYGLRPARCLEIGTFQGGSAALVCAALDDAFGDDLESGRLVCVDPEPQLLAPARRFLARRATVLRGASPEVLGEARRRAGGPFDFALIDGDHSDQGVLRDVEGTLEHLADDAHLLFHDCHFAHVRDGIDEALRRHPELIDAGVLSTAANPTGEKDDRGRPVVWGGLRLLRFRRVRG